MSRHNFERVRDVSGDPYRVEPPNAAPLSVLREGVAPSPDLLITEILLPILERVNASLDELEAAVARIAEAPHGNGPGKLGVDWFQCRDCLVSDGLNNIPDEHRSPCPECLEQLVG